MVFWYCMVFSSSLVLYSFIPCYCLWPGSWAQVSPKYFPKENESDLLLTGRQPTWQQVKYLRIYNDPSTYQQSPPYIAILVHLSSPVHLLSCRAFRWVNLFYLSLYRSLTIAGSIDWISTFYRRKLELTYCWLHCRHLWQDKLNSWQWIFTLSFPEE